MYIEKSFILNHVNLLSSAAEKNHLSLWGGGGGGGENFNMMKQEIKFH